MGFFIGAELVLEQAEDYKAFPKLVEIMAKRNFL